MSGAGEEDIGEEARSRCTSTQARRMPNYATPESGKLWLNVSFFGVAGKKTRLCEFDRFLRPLQLTFRDRQPFSDKRVLALARAQRLFGVA